VSATTLFLILVAALALGAVLGYLWGQLRAARRIGDLRAALEGAQARVAGESERQREQIALLERSELQLRVAFEQVANESLKGNSETFLTLARESLARDQTEASGQLKERESAIAALVAPLKLALEKSEAQVALLERERREAYAGLRTQIEGLSLGQQTLSRETRNLVSALRRPEVRGRWGEMTLRRIVEIAGLAEHCDFTEQMQLATAHGALRPDMVVHMSQSRDLVVDAKTPLDAYLAAIEAGSDEERDAALQRHAGQVAERVRELASKAYWEQFARSPDFAVLFLPGDQFLSAALGRDPELLDNALRRNVIVATPSTLVALLKVIALGWRQEQVAQHAATIHALGQELHRRLLTFTGNLGKVGKALNSAVDAYNSAVGSLERSVLPQARRFSELGVTQEPQLPALEPVEKLAREPGRQDLDAPTRSN
jgi:DNA recombination protein RmuC